MNFPEPSVAAAFGLGLWTAMQPCPLTANLAAVAYLGRRAGSSGGAVAAALLYAAGQLIAYVALAVLILRGMASTWRVSEMLQQHVSLLLGPIWILAGMVLLGLVHFRLPGLGVSPRWHARIDAWGAWSGLPLGVVLALNFCPVSATIFFMDLLAISESGRSHFIYPAIYASGAALPVLLLAAALGAGSRWLGAAIHRTQQVQRWLNLAAGGLLLALGVYYALKYNFQVWTPA